VTEPIPCAGAVVVDEQSRLLLVRRRNFPNAGRWSIPGGRCEKDEPPARACVRETLEETGLRVRVLRYLGTVELPAPGGRTYTVDDFVCSLEGGSLRAGDDAADARWVTEAEFTELPLASGLAAALADWQVWPTSDRTGV